MEITDHKSNYTRKIYMEIANEGNFNLNNKVAVDSKGCSCQCYCPRDYNASNTASAHTGMQC